MFTSRKTIRYCGYAAVGMGIGVGVFDIMNHNVLSRSVKGLGTGAYVGYLYKTTEPNSIEELNDLHRKAATIILNTCLENEGLYIKLGQGLSAMNHIMPPVMTEVFAVLLDNAPTITMDEVRAIVTEELNGIQAKGVHKVGAGVANNIFDDVFVSFDETPIAAASIAQVHRAVIRDPITKENIAVAVKVQKPKIKTQIWWDLTCYYILCLGVEKAFGIPLVFNAKTINKEMSREVDFNIEADNANIMRECLQLVAPPGVPAKTVAARGDNQRPHIFIPEIYNHLLSERLMVSEWVEGVKLSDRKAVDTLLKSKGASKGDLIQGVMDTFADMVFTGGILHVDPHGANLMLREKRPQNNTPTTNNSHAIGTKGLEIVLLDFGLCITETEAFKHSYALFFKAMYSADIEMIKEIVGRWGIGDGELFASLTLQRPFSSKRPMKKEGSTNDASSGTAKLSQEEIREMETQMKDRISSFLRNEEMVPRELIFVGRCLNILRALNKDYGSPVNRMNIFAERAIAALKHDGLRNLVDVDEFVALKGDLISHRPASVTAAAESPFHPGFTWKWSEPEQKVLSTWSANRRRIHRAETGFFQETSDYLRINAIFLVFSSLHIFHKIMQTIVVPSILFCVPSMYKVTVRRQLAGMGLDESFEDVMERKEDEAIQQSLFGDDRRYVEEQKSDMELKKSLKRQRHPTMDIAEND